MSERTKLIFPYLSNRVSASLFNVAGILRIIAGLFLLYQAVKNIPQNEINPQSNFGLLIFTSLQTVECIARIPYVWDKIYARYQLYAMAFIYFIISIIYFQPYIKKLITLKFHKKNQDNYKEVALI